MKRKTSKLRKNMNPEEKLQMWIKWKEGCDGWG